jgi:hypothetical protein
VRNRRPVEQVLKERAQYCRRHDDEDDDGDFGISSPGASATLKVALIAPAQSNVLPGRSRHRRRA